MGSLFVQLSGDFQIKFTLTTGFVVQGHIFCLCMFMCIYKHCFIIGLNNNNWYIYEQNINLMGNLNQSKLRYLRGGKSLLKWNLFKGEATEAFVLNCTFILSPSSLSCPALIKHRLDSLSIWWRKITYFKFPFPQSIQPQMWVDPCASICTQIWNEGHTEQIHVH